MLENFLKNSFVVKILSCVTAIVAFFTSNYSATFSKIEPVEPTSAVFSTVPEYADETDLLTLAENGETNYSIVYSDTANRSEIYAANELKKYFDAVTFADIPLIPNTASVATPYKIFIGKAYTGIALEIPDDLGDDGYYIAADGNDIVITGGEIRGTMYGVYSFLEKFLGCRFFTSKLEVVPEIDTLSFPADTSIYSKPAFVYRDTSWRNAWNAVWRGKVGLNGSMTAWHSPLDETNYDMLNYGGYDAGHTLQYCVPAAQYFESNPEYFALFEGKRDKGQLCMTNEDVYQLSLQSLLSWIAAKPGAEYFSMSQNDNQHYCHCAACAKIDKEEGSPAGTLLRFVNRLASDIKAAGHDNIYIHTFAYQYTRKPPKLVKPADNVIIQLCSIEANHAAPYKTSDKDFYNDLVGWSKITDKLFIWDYNTNFAHYLNPTPDIDNIQPNIQMFYEYNAIGCFEQGNSAAAVNGEFGELRAYLIAKLQWDPYCDIEAIKNEFMYYYYGPGYTNILEYMKGINAKKTKSFDCFEAPEDTVRLNEFDLHQIDLVWDAAENAAEDEVQLSNIQRSRLQVQYYKSVSRKGEFMITRPYDERLANGKALYDSIIALGIDQLSEGNPIMQNPNFFDKASKWNTSR